MNLQISLSSSVPPLFLDDPSSRRELIEAGNQGLVNALRRHFAEREREPRSSSGFPAFGQSFPKSYFWRGTRGKSVAEQIRVSYSSPADLASEVSVASPALAHKLNPSPPPITPKGGRKYLAIPASPAAAAWAAMPRDFPNLAFAYSKTPDGHLLPSLVPAPPVSGGEGVAPRPAPASPHRSPISGRAASAAPVYWLVRSVRTPHDPRALPQQSTQNAAVLAAVRSALKALSNAP